MAVSFIDIVTEVEEQLNNKRIRSKVKKWVNIAQRRIGAKFPWTFLEKEFTTTTTTTAPNFYTLPEDFMVPLSVRFKNTAGSFRKLNAIPIEFEDNNFPKQTDQSDSPERAIFTGRTLLIRPGIKTAGQTLLIRVLVTPPEMILDTDKPIFPEAHRDVLISGGALIGSRWLWNDKGDQDRFKAEFLESVKDMIDRERGGTAFNENMGLDQGWVEMMQDAGSVGAGISF